MSFYQRALEAAKTSLEAFRAECAKPDANVNEKEHGNGEYLIFALIDCLKDDEEILGCLQIMHPYGLNISVKNQLNKTLLLVLTLQKMPKSLDFLISIGASVKESYVLFALSEEAIGQTHNTDINQQTRLGYTALILAAQKNCFHIIQYLLSKNANLLPRVLLYSETESHTAISTSYCQYNKAIANNRDSTFLNNAKACFELLLEAASKLFYSRGPMAPTLELELLDALAGSFRSTVYKEQNSEALKKIIIEQALNPAKALMQEQRLSFFMASKAKDEHNVPLKKDFLNASHYDANTTKIIFSFLHGSICINEQPKLESSETITPAAKI